MKKIISLLFLILILGCEVDKDSPTNSSTPIATNTLNTPKIGVDNNGNFVYNFAYNNDKEFTYGLMKEIYLWNEDIPSLDDVNSYASPHEVMRALQHDKDIWSHILTTDEYYSYFSDGEFVGYGIDFMFIKQESGLYNLRITSMQEDSVFYSEDIRKGDIISSVDELTFTDVSENELESLWYALYDKLIDGDSHDFIFISNIRGDVEVTSEPKTLNIKSINSRLVYNYDDMNIGYMSMGHFIEPTESELIETFDFFRTKEVDELIIDFRGNPGGQIQIAAILIDILIGDNHAGDISFKYKFNKKYSGGDVSMEITDGGYDFNFNRVVFLTDRRTASASELVISSLKPYIDVVLVGENTHGKPVGMIGFENNDYVYFPISFKVDNAEDFGDYYEGLIAHVSVNDEFSYDYGDTDDPVISQAINVITTGLLATHRGLDSNKSFYKVDSGLRGIVGLY